MTFKKITLLLLALATSAYADEASHRKVAAEMLDLVSGPQTFAAGLALGIDPMLKAMKQQGAPDAAIADMRAAFEDWVNTEFRWEDLKPQMIDLYVREFSEAELTEILAFYRTPTGRKTLAALPKLLAAGGKIGQEYAATKQASLVERVNKVVAKYHLK